VHRVSRVCPGRAPAEPQRDKAREGCDIIGNELNDDATPNTAALLDPGRLGASDGRKPPPSFLSVKKEEG